MRRLAVVGVAILLLGFATLFVRDLAAVFDLQFTFVTLLGVLALVQSLRFLQAGRRAPRRATETGDPERRYEASVPGDTVDASVVRASGFSRYGKTTRRKLRKRVRRTAVAAVAAREGCTEEAAQDRVDAGEWTDDPVAAWFVGDDVGLPRREQAKLLFSRGSRFRSGLSRTVAAIAAVETGGSARAADSAADGADRSNGSNGTDDAAETADSVLTTARADG